MKNKALTIPTLTTERLTLEPISWRVSEGMFSLWSDADVCRYSGTVTDYDRNAIEMPAATCAESDKIIDFWLKATNDGWGFRWVVRITDKDEFTGTVGFNSLNECSEIAFHLLPKYWGKGIMSEASIAAIQWRRSQGTCSEIEAFVEPENAPSIALIERLGMKATDVFSEGAQRYRLSV